jgi:hypothetical protein
MGNKHCGKEVDRESKEPIIPHMDRSVFATIFDAKNDEGTSLTALEFVASRIET